MCSSSTATPAASGGSAFSGALRKTSSGRRRLPPAASDSLPDRSDDSRVRLDRALEPRLEHVEVRVEPRRRADLGQRGGHSFTPVCSATMPPANSR